MPLPVKVSGAFRPTFKYIKINGAWRAVPQVYVKFQGHWRPLYTYSWVAGAWGSCSASCGGGTQYRGVICQRQDGYKVDASTCIALAPGYMPATSQSCNTQSCDPTGTCSSLSCSNITCTGYFFVYNQCYDSPQICLFNKSKNPSAFYRNCDQTGALACTSATFGSEPSYAVSYGGKIYRPKTLLTPGHTCGLTGTGDFTGGYYYLRVWSVSVT